MKSLLMMSLAIILVTVYLISQNRKVELELEIEPKEPREESPH